MRKLYLYLLFSLAVALPWLNGCIKEDRDDCTGKVVLRFRYVGDGTTDIFPDKIDKVTMYVFATANGALVGTFEYDKSALEAFQGADLRLFPGRYKIVCWGNALDNSYIRAGDRIAAPEYFRRENIPTNDRLYYGSTELEVPETLAETERVCDFVSSHVKVQVRLEGFNGTVIPVPGYDDQAPLGLVIIGLAAYTDFDNVPSETELCAYYPVLTVDPESPSSYVACFNTLRFSDESDILLQVVSGTSIVCEFSLTDFLRRFEIAVEGCHEVVVPILIRANSAGIVVEDWNREEVTPGFE